MITPSLGLNQSSFFSDESTNFPCVDYSEKRSLPISIPDYKFSDRDGERFVVRKKIYTQDPNSGLVQYLRLKHMSNFGMASEKLGLQIPFLDHLCHGKVPKLVRGY